MAHKIEAGFLGDIFEMAPAKILEEVVSVPHGGNKQVRQPIVINVGKGSSNADLIRQPHSRGCGNVLELAMAQIAPKLVGAQLRSEIDIEQAIAIDISHGHAAAMVVMDGFI